MDRLPRPSQGVGTGLGFAFLAHYIVLLILLNRRVAEESP